MKLVAPELPDFDLEEWARRPYPERLKAMAQHWALHGFGAPAAIYVFYAVKIAVYVAGWAWFASLTPGLGGPGAVASWWAEPIAFQKAVVWTFAFEGLGLGCASGPLTARYVPPFGGLLYFARRGTTRLPPWPRLPMTAGHRRTLVDVALYLGLYAALARALLATSIGAAEVMPIVVALVLVGLRDKTVFLATRAEHYATALLVFAFPADLLAGSKAVQWAIWFWAATSKLNHHFPSVIAVMISNHPFVPKRFKRAMYRRYPDDLRPSRLAATMAHGGTAYEYLFPLLLVFGGGGWMTTVGLVAMISFHVYIASSVPMGVPIEWNVFFIYSGLVLFGAHADVSVFSIDSSALAAILIGALLVVPLVGNLRPEWVSFLPSMRYYAGNWATSLWCFRGDAARRLDQCLVKVAEDVPDQLRRFYDEPTTRALLGKALAFRAMHLHGRALNDLLLRAVDDVEAYDVHDGEWVAGIVLGWNFGDGHLHHEQLLEAVQEQCGFEEGELVCVFLESQPLHRRTLHWRIHDAAAGLREQGHVRARDLLASQPWPDRVTA